MEPNFDPRFSIFNFGTGGGIRTLINWFLRPAPLPDWATPVKFEDAGWRIEDVKFDPQCSIFYPRSLKRRLQESNLHRNSPGGLAHRCHTIRRRLRFPGSQLGLRRKFVRLCFPPAIVLTNFRLKAELRTITKEGERFELSQAEACRFSGPVHCQLCEPSASGTRRTRTSISSFGDRRVTCYTMFPCFLVW